MPSEALKNYLDAITDPNGHVVASPKQIKRPSNSMTMNTSQNNKTVMDVCLRT